MEGEATAQEEVKVELLPTVQVLALTECEVSVIGLTTVTAVVVAIVTKVSIGTVFTSVMTL